MPLAIKTTRRDELVENSIFDRVLPRILPGYFRGKGGGFKITSSPAKPGIGPMEFSISDYVSRLQHAKSRTGFTVFHLLSSETEVDGAGDSPISSSRSRRTWICSQVPYSTSSRALNLTFPPLQACILFFSVTVFTVYPRS